MVKDLDFRIAVIALIFAMKIIRWRTNRLTGWKASWPGLLKNPLDTAILFTWAALAGVVLVAWLIDARWVAVFDVALPAWLRWAGAAASVAGLALLAWGDWGLGSNLSITLQIKQDHTLVTSGPYRRIRHPIYAGALLAFAGMSVVAANWLFAASLFGGMLAVYAVRIPREEKMMIGRFGDEYRRYMRRTGRLLPRLGVGTGEAAVEEGRPKGG